MNSQRFEGKIALVTGGTKGIGKAIAARLAAEGCDVAVGFMRNRQDAEQAVKEMESFGVRSIALRGNVGREQHIERIFRQVEEELGGLDYFISNAATGALKPAMELTAGDWEMSLNIIARALLLGAQRAVPMMEKRGGGKIVAVTSHGSFRCIEDYTAVGAAKAALDATVRYLAVELIKKKINVNAVCPGITDTFSFSLFPRYDEMRERAIKYTPGGKLTSPEDVASVVSFLLSEDASWIVGEIVTVDGGASLII